MGKYRNESHIELTTFFFINPYFIELTTFFCINYQPRIHFKPSSISSFFDIIVMLDRGAAEHNQGQSLSMHPCMYQAKAGFHGGPPPVVCQRSSNCRSPHCSWNNPKWPTKIEVTIISWRNESPSVSAYRCSWACVGRPKTVKNPYWLRRQQERRGGEKLEGFSAYELW